MIENLIGSGREAISKQQERQKTAKKFFFKTRSFLEVKEIWLFSSFFKKRKKNRIPLKLTIFLLLQFAGFFFSSTFSLLLPFCQSFSLSLSFLISLSFFIYIFLYVSLSASLSLFLPLSVFLLSISLSLSIL